MEFIGEFSVSPDDLRAYRERSFVPSKNSVGVLAGIEARLSHPLELFLCMSFGRPTNIRIVDCCLETACNTVGVLVICDTSALKS